MGKWDEVAKLLGHSSEAMEGASKSARKVPYKVKASDGELALSSAKAKAHGEFRLLDTVEAMDPEMVSFLEGIGENPFYLSTLEAQKGYGGRALKAIENEAKKRGADSAYLNASPLGGTRGLSQKEAAAKLKEFYKKHGYETAVDQGTNAMMYKKLALAGLLGGGAASTLGGAEASAAVPKTEMSPLPYLRDVANAYESAKKKITDPLAGQLNITKDPKHTEEISSVLSTVADPVNLVPGATGIGLGALQMTAGDRPLKEYKYIDDLLNGPRNGK